MNPAIVIVTYNRPASLSRLFSFLQNCHFDHENISLVISIDFQDSDKHRSVVQIANDFNWKYGEKKIIQHEKNLGLKQHVLQCGDLSEQFGAVIVLEDDIVVAPYFYNYAVQALKAYDHDVKIAGISLYNWEWSQVADRAFAPAQNGSDVYFIQSAQSWGQVWSKRMWQDFKEWYLAHNDLKINAHLPDNVMTWSAKSWLKYHIWFCVDQNKYFVYPYASQSTNYSDLGVHLKGDNTYFQVSLATGEREVYDLPAFTDNSYKYDVFFERENLGNYIGVDNKELCTDIYGKKKEQGKQKILADLSSEGI